MPSLIRKMRQLGQRGQGMVEYPLILVLVSVVVIAVLTALGAQIKAVFVNISLLWAAVRSQPADL